MNSEKNTNIESESSDICPVTGLPVLRKPEWTDVSFGTDFKVSYSILGDNICLGRSSGYGTIHEIEKTLGLSKKIIDEAFADGRPYVQINDYANLRGVSIEGRKFYIANSIKRKQLRGIIFYGTSPIFNMSINLAMRLNVVPFEAHIVKDYPEAVRLALEILHASGIEPEVSPTINGMSKPLADPGTPHREIITRDDWSMETDNYSVHFEVIDGDILHSIGAGIFEENLIEPLGKLREKVITSGVISNVSYYSVIGLGGIEKVSWKARRLYIESVK